MSRALWLCALLALPAFAAGKKVLIDAPRPLKALLEKQLKKTNALGSIELSAEPTGGEVKGACLDQAAVAVVTGRLERGQYTVMVLNGADGSPLSSFKFRAPAGKKPLKLPKEAAASLKSGIADARAPSREAPPRKVVEPEPEPVTRKAEPEPEPEPVKKAAPERTTRKSVPPPEPEAEAEATVDEPKSTAVKPTALRLGIGAGLFTRRFFYVDDLFGVLSRYSLPAGAAPRVELDLYPGAFVTTGIAANLGVMVDAAFSVGLSSSKKDPASGTTVTYGSSALKLHGSLTARLPVGPLTINPLIGYSLQSFSISAGTDGSRTNVPNVSYGGLRFGAQLKLHVAGPLSVQGLFAYEALLSKGEIGSAAYFPRATGGGLDAALAVPIAITRNFEVRVTGEYTRVWFSMNPQPGDPYIAGGALDDSFGVSVTAAFVL